MFDPLYSQIARLLLQTSSYKEASLFGEKRMIYFANGSEGEGGDGGEDDDTLDETEVEEEKPVEPKKPQGSKKPEVATGVEPGAEGEPSVPAPELIQVSEGTADRVEGTLRVIDELGYNLPPGITEKQIKEARTNVSTLIEQLDPLNNQMETLVLQFIQEGLNETTDNQSELFKGVRSVVRRLIYEFSHAKDVPTAKKPMVQSVAVKLRGASYELTKETKRVDMATANKYGKLFMALAEQIADKEHEMVKTINDVKETMWDFSEKAKKKQLDKRVIKEQERYVGLPLKEGQILVGDADIVGYVQDETTGEQSLSTTKTQRWKIRKVYVNDKTDPGDEKSTRKGVWIELQKENSAKWQTMSPKMLKDFASFHDLKPDIDRKEQLPEAVPYMKEMQLEFGDPPFTLEYKGFNYDAAGNPTPAAKKVEITQMDASGVTFAEPVIYRSRFQTVDLAQDDTKDQMTYAEFAKWLNMTYAIPEISQQGLQGKLDEYSKQLNAFYQVKDSKTGKFLSRDPECHGSIKLQPGEIIYSEAPGSPLYKIEKVDPANGGQIHLSAGGNAKTTFTFNEFLRWVYQYELERYDPEYEVNKCVKYGNVDANDEETKQKIRVRAKGAKDNLENPNKWREDIKNINIRDEIVTEKADGKPYIPGGENGEKPEIPFVIREALHAQQPSYNFMRKFWNETQFLTVDDLGQLFKSGYDYYLRNWERRRKKRYSTIGQGIPFFGTEFERVNQQAENEEVGQFKDAMDQWGVWQIEETLYGTGNRDQAKACLTALSEKGMVRWDNPKLWLTINKFTDEYHQIPWPLHYTSDPTQPYAKGVGTFAGRDVAKRTGMDLLPEAIDSLWGEGTHVGWKRGNDDTIESNIQKSYNKAEELENDPKNTGGIASELAFLLEKHMSGEYVDPSEFEGMLRFIIEVGKAAPNDKMYYLLMGATLEKNGRTLMGWERIGRFISKYCNNFPAIDYFTDKTPRRHPTEPGKFVTGPWVKADFAKFTETWRGSASADKYRPPISAGKFLWDEVLTSDALQIRLEKGIRNAEKMDHDDTPLFIPALKESAIDDICSNSAGSSKKFTIQGYKNAYLGFGIRLNSLTSKFDQEKQLGETGFDLSGQYQEKIINAFNAFIRYDAILDDRYERSNKSFQRFKGADFRSGCVWDSRPLSHFQTEMQETVQEVIKAYGKEDDGRFKLLFDKNPPPPFVEDPKERDRLQREYEQKQKQINNSIREFGTHFTEMIESDPNGATKMLDIIRKREFKAQEVVDNPLSKEQQLRNKLLLEITSSDSSSSPTAEA
ncbi:hypothetical protein ACFL3C_03410 [Patescibacteria group bacterium]